MMKGAVECAVLDNENSRRAIQASQQTYPSEGLGFHQPEKFTLYTDDDPQRNDQRSHNKAGVSEILSGHHWPRGFQDSFINTLAKIPIRYFICDNSNVMAKPKGAPDGFRLSKWAQLTPNLKFHASLAHYGCVLTEFRLLNTGTPYLLGANGVVDMTTFDLLNVVLDQQANGTADLRYHMEQVFIQIKNNADRWNASGQKAHLILFVEGPPSDVDISCVLSSLKGLPVCVILRLCCDDNRVEEWRRIVQGLEASLEINILLDFDQEVAKIATRHPLVNYREFLHQMRELGVNTKEEECIQCATQFTLTNLSKPFPQPQSATSTSESSISLSYPPRLMDLTYVIVHEESGVLRPLGTAWVVESHSRQLLLTACHCVKDWHQKGNLYVAKKLSRVGEKIIPEDCISVHPVYAVLDMDVAVLRADLIFEASISLCPLQEYPNHSNEDEVKSYHCPIRLFMDGISPLTASATKYDTIHQETDSLLIIAGQHMKGSSGGVVVDKEGRAVALISGGIMPGVRPPVTTKDSIEKLVETVNVIVEGSGTFTYCVKLINNDLRQYLNCN